MQTLLIDSSSRIIRSTIGKNTEIREYSTVHDSTIGPDCHIYEHVSIKKAAIGRGVAVNSGTYIENATIEDDILIGPNCSIVDVTHQISKEEINKENKFSRVTIRHGAFVLNQPRPRREKIKLCSFLPAAAGRKEQE